MALLQGRAVVKRIWAFLGVVFHPAPKIGALVTLVGGSAPALLLWGLHHAWVAVGWGAFALIVLLAWAGYRLQRKLEVAAEALQQASRPSPIMFNIGSGANLRDVNFVGNTMVTAPAPISAPTVLSLADIVGETGSFLVEGRNFRSATIIGPGVMTLLGRVTLERNHLPSPPEEWIFEIAGGTLLGVVGFKDCGFFDCEFKDVGVAALKPDRDRMIAAFGGSARGTVQ